jgi:hypothetical protein
MVARTSKAEAPAWPTDVIAFGAEEKRAPRAEAVPLRDTISPVTIADGHAESGLGYGVERSRFPNPVARLSLGAPEAVTRSRPRSCGRATF